MAQAVQAIGRKAAEGNEHTMTDAKDKIPVQRDRFEAWYYEQENHSLRAERMAMSYAEAKAAFDAGWNAAQPAEAQQEPVARVVPFGATVKLEWASTAAAHNCKPGPLYAAQPAPAAVPPGYVLVPIEPTPEMIDAGLGKLLYVASPQPRHIYRAMIAAAKRVAP